MGLAGRECSQRGAPLSITLRDKSGSRILIARHRLMPTSGGGGGGKRAFPCTIYRNLLLY